MFTYKFSSCAKDELPREITFEDIKQKYLNGPFTFGIDNLIGRGTFLLEGWCYNFQSELKKFVYKWHGRWFEGYAPNRTLLRKATYGKIEKILDLE